MDTKVAIHPITASVTFTKNGQAQHPAVKGLFHQNPLGTEVKG